MSNLAERLIWLGFQPRVDFVLQDDADGNGVYLKQWLSSKPEPSQAALDAAAAPGPSAADVETERDRRLALGFPYSFPPLSDGTSDPRGTHRIGTTPKDMKGWQEVSDWSLSQITTSSTDRLAIVTDTGPCTITAMEWQAILKEATQFRQPIYQAAFAMEAVTPIPADYTADTHWPQVK